MPVSKKRKKDGKPVHRSVAAAAAGRRARRSGRPGRGGRGARRFGQALEPVRGPQDRPLGAARAAEPAVARGAPGLARLPPALPATAPSTPARPTTCPAAWPATPPARAPATPGRAFRWSWPGRSGSGTAERGAPPRGGREEAHPRREARPGGFDGAREARRRYTERMIGSCSSTSARRTRPRRPRCAATCASSSPTRASSTSTRSARKLLLELVILPFRPRKSAAAYAKVWSAEGSPLLTLSRALEGKVRAAMGPGHLVELAMRYGRPSIPEALERLRAGRGDAARGGAALPAVLVVGDRLLARGGLRRAGPAPRGDAGRGPAGLLRRPGVHRGLRRGGRAGARPGEARPRALQLPRPARAAREGLRPLRPPLPPVGRLLRRHRPGQPRLLPGPVPRHGAGAGRPARPRAGELEHLLPVAAGPDALDQALHRRGARRAREGGEEAALRLLPGLRGRLPGDAGGDRPARPGAVRRRRRARA